jgi:hypothetical protein
MRQGREKLPSESSFYHPDESRLLNFMKGIRVSVFAYFPCIGPEIRNLSVYKAYKKFNFRVNYFLFLDYE